MNADLHMRQPASTALSGAHLAEVVSVEDPMRLGRVQIKLAGTDPDSEAPQWARVATAFAGDNRGAFFIPDVGDEVLVMFIGGSAHAPVVVGSLWNGAGEVPEELPGSRVDRWTLTGKNGTRIAIIEENTGGEKVEIETPNGNKIRVTDQGGGKIKLTAAGSTIKITPDGVTVETPAVVSIDAAMMTISAGLISVDCGVSMFSGMVQCQTLLTNSVISPSYTPGAGNVW